MRPSPRSPGAAPRPSGLLALAFLVLSGGLGGAPPAAAQQDAAVREMENRYVRANQLLGWNVEPMMAGLEVDPQWMEGGNRFWYRNGTGNGHEFVVVDPDARSRRQAFDHDRLAAAMSEAADTAYIGRKLPFNDFEWVDGESAIAFETAKKRFRCDLGQYVCEIGDTTYNDTPYVRSPDGEWEAFVHEYDLYVRPTGGGDSTRLTTDGEQYWAYGIEEPRPGQIIAERPQRPTLQWSPDSRRIAVQRMDERGVEMLPLYSSTSQRPKYYLYPYALPGDSIIPRFDIHVIDVEAGSNVRIDHEPQPYLGYGSTGVMDSTWVTVQWVNGSDDLYFTHTARGDKRLQLMHADPETGDARLIVRDSMYSYVEPNLDIRGKPNWRVLNGGEDIVWFSERDGWAHLYRFDGQGNLKNQITSGDWTVGTIIHVDEAQGRIFFTARGREEGRIPVIQDLYAVNLDGSGLELLGGERADHNVQATPDGRYFVDTYSRVDMKPTTVLRDRSGNVLMTVQESDLGGAEALGWSYPETFTVKARDGVTDIYGLIYKPSHFDSTKTYPVVEYIYPGPFIGSVGFWTFEPQSRGDADALAELGFVVVVMDHLGSPFRSKAFQDNYFGNMGDNGLPDHITGLKQLAARNPWMDLTRVGIFGHSGGGFASTDAILRYPDFYKVAVSSAGNHDNRTYHQAYGEKYHGLLVEDTVTGGDNFESQANFLLAENLEGKLMLATGDMDDNVHPSMTLRVADALIDANKSFDFLIMPDRAHGMNEPYFVRVRWDYFVEHLMGREPPRDFQVTRPEG